MCERRVQYETWLNMEVKNGFVEATTGIGFQGHSTGL